MVKKTQLGTSWFGGNSPGVNALAVKRQRTVQHCCGCIPRGFGVEAVVSTLCKITAAIEFHNQRNVVPQRKRDLHSADCSPPNDQPDTWKHLVALLYLVTKSLVFNNPNNFI